MIKRVTMKRRRFIRNGAFAALATQVNFVKAANDSRWPIAIFEKVFEGLSYSELAQALAEIGADGVEATIRPGGHIEPKVAQAEVPKMQAALKAKGQRIVIAATHIRSVDEPTTRPLLETLVQNRVTHYRMGHYHYDLAKPLMPQLKQFAKQVAELAELNKELGIQGLYQNHSGSSSYKRGYVGALGWDAAMMLEGVDPLQMISVVHHVVVRRRGRFGVLMGYRDQSLSKNAPARTRSVVAATGT